MAQQAGLDAEEAGLSELEAMKCYIALSVLEAALQSECSACQKEFVDERVVYWHLWYYAKLWEMYVRTMESGTAWKMWVI